MDYIKLMILVVILSFSFESLTAQYEIEYKPIDEYAYGHYIFTRVIDKDVYHFTLNKGLGSELIRIKDGEPELLTSFYDINDTLRCEHLLDFWKEDDAFRFLAYTHSDLANYLTLCSYDIENDNITVLDIMVMDKYFLEYHFNFKFKNLVVNGQRQYICTNAQRNMNASRITLFSITGNTITATKNNIDIDDKVIFIYDVFYDEYNRKYVVLMGDQYFYYDEAFRFLNKQKVRVKRDDTVYGNQESLIMGQDNESITIYERYRKYPFNPPNSRISVRVATIRDTVFFPTKYNDFEPDVDCYYMRKIVKDSCNYLYYSRSSNGAFNKDFGFNVITVSKKGEFLGNQSFTTDEPLAIFDIDVDEVSKTICGNGAYFDEVEQTIQFSFCAKLDTKVSTEETEIKDKQVLINNIDNNFLLVNEAFTGSNGYIFNVSGQLVSVVTLNELMDIRDLSSGIYYILIADKQHAKPQRFVKL